MNNTTIDQAFGETVRTVLAVRNETQSDLVPVLGMRWASVNQRIRGKQGWKLREVEILAAHFGCEPVDLFQGTQHAVMKVMRYEAPRQRATA